MSKLFKADHARQVELAGVGPAPRPVDIDQSQTGFKALRTLRIYRFEPPAVIHGHAEEDEVFVVVMAGEIELRIRSEHWSRSDECFTLRAADPASSVPCAAYLPPHAEYALTPRTAADVAYARALPAGARSPAIFSTSPRGGTGPCRLLDQPAYAERLRLQLWHAGAHEQDTDLNPAEGPAAGSAAAGSAAAGSAVASSSEATLGVADETLIHVRSTPARAVAVATPGLAGIALDSWDTLGVYPGEQPCLRIAARSTVLSLVVSAR